METKLIKIQEKTKEIKIPDGVEQKLILDIKSKELNLTIHVGENSQVSFLILSYLQDKLILNLKAHVGRYSTLTYIGGFLNDLTNVQFDLLLDGEYSEGYVNSLIISNQQQEQTAKYEVINNAKYSQGHIDVIGLSKDQASVKVDGIGRINKGMHSSNNQQHLVGLISEDAKLEMNPFLLIDEFDVQAGHGASIGQIDREILYYMMSRGLTHKEAEILYLKGLVNPFMAKIFDEDLKVDFTKEVWRELSNEKN